jgi:hypothetical protein
MTVGSFGTGPMPVNGFFGFGLGCFGFGFGFGSGFGFGAATAEDVEGGGLGGALELGADEPPPLHADSASATPVMTVMTVMAVRDAPVELDTERVTWFPPWRC